MKKFFIFLLVFVLISVSVWGSDNSSLKEIKQELVNIKDSNYKIMTESIEMNSKLNGINTLMDNPRKDNIPLILLGITFVGAIIISISLSLIKESADRYKIGYFTLLKRTRFLPWSLIGLCIILVSTFLEFTPIYTTNNAISLVFIVVVAMIGIVINFRKGFSWMEIIFIVIYITLGFLAFTSKDLRAILSILGLVFIFSPLTNILDEMAKNGKKDNMNNNSYHNSKRTQKIQINPKKEEKVNEN